MAVPRPVPGNTAATLASIQALCDAVDAAASEISALQTGLNNKPSVADVQAIAQQLQSAVADLQSQISSQSATLQGEINAQGVAINTKASSADVQALNAIQSATAQDLQRQILAVIERVNGQIAALEAASASNGDLAAVSTALASQRLDYLQDGARPGDGPNGFVLAKNVAALQSANGMPLLPATMLATGDDGNVVRLTQAGIVARRRPIALEVGRVYRATAVVRRRIDVTDPAGDAVMFGVAWLNQSGSLLKLTPSASIKLLRTLAVSDGRTTFETTISRSASTLPLITAPYGARYAIPFVQSFGVNGALDIEVLSLIDASEATLLPPVSQDVVARVDALDSADLPTRISTVESAVQNPASVTFATRGDAVAASVPASALSLLLTGNNAVGDGRGNRYRRVTANQAANGPAGASFQSADGAWWLRVDQGIHDPDLAPDATNFTPSFGGDTRHYRGKLSEVNASPFDFQSLVVGGDWGPAITAAANAAASAFRILSLQGAFPTKTPIVLPGNLHIIGKSYIVGMATTRQDCLVRLTDSAIRVTGSIEANAGYSTLYDQAYLLVADQPQYLELDGLNAAGAQVAYCLGTRDKPASLISEGVGRIGKTYGCPGVLRVISTEGYIAVSAPIYSADALGGPASWAALPKFGLHVVGASVAIGLGTLECTTAVNGYLVLGEPLNAPGHGLVWPQVWLDGLISETAMPLVKFSNPLGLTGSNDTNRRGSISVRGCRGAHSQNREAFIQTDADFAGDIHFESDNKFWVGVPNYLRSFPNVRADNPDAQIYVKRDAFTTQQGFQHWLAGSVGGTVHFETMQIARAFDLQQQAFPAGQLTPLIFKRPDGTTGAYQRFASCYDANAGTFTIPHGDLEDFTLALKVALVPATGGTQAGLTGRLYVFENGLEADEVGISGGSGVLTYRRGSMSAGTVLSFLIAMDAPCKANAIAATSSFTIEASR